jgi:hypothetical protein
MKVDYHQHHQQQHPSSPTSLSFSSSSQQQLLSSNNNKNKVVVIVPPCCASGDDDSNSMPVMSVDQVLASIEKHHQLDNGTTSGGLLLMRTPSEACLTEGTAPTLEMDHDSMMMMEDGDMDMSDATHAAHHEIVVGGHHSSSDDDNDDDGNDDDDRSDVAMDMDILTEVSEDTSGDCFRIQLQQPAIIGSSSIASSHSMIMRRSAIKQSSLQSLSANFILDKKNAWKSLPKPNLEQIFSLSDRTCPGRIQSTVSNNVTTSAAATTTTGLRRRVSFDTVIIREYEQTLGDNPSVSYGPPIQLDWSYTCCNPIALEDYELNRRPRRKMRQMALNYYHRRNVLQWCCGATEEELRRAERCANKCKRERALTVAMLPARRFEDFFESASRKVKKSKSKRQQQQQQQQQQSALFEQPQALAAPPGGATASTMRGGGAGLPQAMAPPPSFVVHQQAQQQQRHVPQQQQTRPGPLAQPPALPHAIVQQHHRPAVAGVASSSSSSSSSKLPLFERCDDDEVCC